MRRILTVSFLFLMLVPAPLGCARTLSGNAPSNASANAPVKSGPAVKADKPNAAQTERIPEDSELTPVASAGCGSESGLKSTRYDTATSLRFRNATKHDVTYYWINYEGRRDQMRTLKAGEMEDRTTFVTHPFVVVDGRDACVAVYMPLEKPGIVVITDGPK